MGTIVASDQNNPKDGIIDVVGVTIYHPIYYKGIIKEEFASAMAGWEPVGDSRLSGGKTIYYESESIDEIIKADIKIFTVIKCLTDNTGGLYPYMPIDDLLKLQE